MQSLSSWGWSNKSFQKISHYQIDKHICCLAHFKSKFSHFFVTFLVVFFPFPRKTLHWARICKRLRSPRIDSKESIPPRIDSKESIPPAYLAWRADTTKQGCRTGPPGWESIPGLLKRFTNIGSELRAMKRLLKVLRTSNWFLSNSIMKQSKICEISFLPQLTMQRFSSSGGSNEILKKCHITKGTNVFLAWLKCIWNVPLTTYISSPDGGIARVFTFFLFSHDFI